MMLQMLEQRMRAKATRHRDALTTCLSTETVQSTARSLQSVHDVEGRDGFPAVESAT